MEFHALRPLVEVEAADVSQHPLWPTSVDRIRPIREVRREYAAHALELNEGNLTTTAKMLGLGVNTLKSYFVGG